MMIFDRALFQRHTTQVCKRGRHFALARRCHHVHVECAVASVSLERSTGVVRLEAISWSKGVDHRVCRILCIEYTAAPDSTVATNRLHHVHLVLDAGALEQIDPDVRRKSRFRVAVGDAWAYSDIYSLSAYHAIM